MIINETTKILIFLLYIVTSIYNMGILFAYFQRNRSSVMYKLQKVHIYTAFILGICGFFVTPTILFLTRYPKYNVKYWSLETDIIGNSYWYKKYMNNTKITGPTTNEQCVDFWKDL